MSQWMFNTTDRRVHKMLTRSLRAGVAVAVCGARAPVAELQPANPDLDLIRCIGCCCGHAAGLLANA